MVRLEQVTKENLDAVLALKVNDCQTGFVSSTAESLAQAYVRDKEQRKGYGCRLMQH